MPKSSKNTSKRKARATSAKTTGSSGKKKASPRAPRKTDRAENTRAPGTGVSPAEVEIARDDQMASLPTTPTRENRRIAPEDPQVLERPLGGDKVLDPTSSQPLMGTASGSDWDYVPDAAIVDVLAETEQIQTASTSLVDALEEHTDESPVLTGGDVDADWQRADDVGEETVGATVATPEQNVVDDLGRAWGVEHYDDEPVHTIDKFEKRDRDRWELNPASGDPASAEAEGEPHE